MTHAPVAAAAAAVLAVVGWTCGGTGLAYLPVWGLAAAPGIPLGRRLFPGPAGVLAGAAVGYTVSCLVVWLVIATGAASAPVFGFAWVVEAIALGALARWTPMRGRSREWTSRETAGLGVVLLLVPVLMAAPYRNLGAEDGLGRRYYRAYFTADFVWHAALAQELGRFEMPPRNPYMASRSLHYYWTYFLVPAAAVQVGPPPSVLHVEPVLKANAILTALLLAGAMFVLALTAGAGPVAAALAVAVVVLASSAEGLVAMIDLWRAGRPLDALREMNVDAVTAWKFGGLRIDGVHRTMLYTPQHGLSAALGLLGLALAAAPGVRASTAAVAGASLLLGLSCTLNPFLGAAFSLIYGLAVAADAVVSRATVPQLARHALAAVGPVLAVLWGTWNAMGEGAGQALTIGWVGFARNFPVLTLLYGLGPVLIPGLAGMLPDRRLPSQPLRVAIAALGVGLFLFYFVMLSEQSWVGFRAGQILLATLPIPLARLFGRGLASGHGVRVGAIVALVLAAGLPTTVADTYNAADIRNLRMGPGFPWTLTVSRAQREGLEWIARETPPRSVVQMEPVLRGRGHWSFIPTFAGRRMAAGIPISLLPVPEYEARSRAVQAVYTAPGPAQAHARARELGIEFLWVDQDDRRAYPAGTAQFAAAPGRFEPVFSNEEVTVYRVR